MTNGEFVSRVINGLGFLNKDEHISRRYILRIGQNKSKFYISQKLLDKSLFREDNLFKTIECLKLRSEDVLKCGIHEFMRCESVMKSVKKVPGLVYSRLGSSIFSVTSLDGSSIYLPITLKSFALSKLRKNSSLLNLKYYYIKDGYIYLPDSEVEFITITYIPYDEEDVKDASECGDEDCSSSECDSIWDNEFKIPDKLSEQVITETINEVSMRRKVQVDESPNLNQNAK